MISNDQNDLHLTRRRFLIQAPAGLGALAGAWEMPACDCLSKPCRYPHAMIQEVANVHYELRVYREVLVPLLVRRLHYNSDDRCLGLGQGDPAKIRAFQHAADRVRDALRDPTARFDAEQAFAAANAATAKFARLLRPAHVDREWLAARCAVHQGRVHWQMPVFFGHPPSVHKMPERARCILSLFQEPTVSEDPITQLRALGPARLIRGCRKLVCGQFEFPVFDLFCIIPEAPPAIFGTPFQNPHYFLGRSAHSSEIANRMVRSEVSDTLCRVMGFLANNHFLRVPALARRPEISGSWLDCMPQQVLDVLYQKVLALRYLRKHPECLGLNQPFPKDVENERINQS